jgi:hypothetical protein
MIIFKSIADLAAMPDTHPLFAIVRSHLARISGLYPCSGYLILVEEEDTKKELNLPELKCPWAEIRWEGVTQMGSCFYCVYLTNNEFGLEFLIPDTNLPPEVRRSLLDHAG